MANCNNLFFTYNKAITPTSTQRQTMKTSRQSLEKKIANKLYEKLGMRVTFYTQGSDAHKMKTIIIKEDGTFDSDRGVYLPYKPNVSGETIQGYIYDAVKDHTKAGAQHRKKCIRVIFQCEYNIDFPAYYEVDGEDFAYMAVKGHDWIKDDPWHLITWLAKYKDADGQCIRMIKYLKGWASKRKCNGKMPSGIALAVWAARNFSGEASRDDKCLLKLLKAIKSAVQYSVTCYAPVEPFDDLTAKLTQSQKSNFQDELTLFCDDAQKAIDETDQLKASKIWRKYLGDRYPEGISEEDEKRTNALLASAGIVTSGAYLGRSGIINPTSGVPHLGHRNYGGKTQYIPYRGKNPVRYLFGEKHLLEKAYDFLKVAVRDNTLHVTGYCQPSDYSKVYEYELRFSPGKPPKVYPLLPQIVYHDDIHMYKRDNSLCLYYPKDFSFTNLSHLFNTIIPWIHEWYLYYELYLLKGKWLHPYVDHKRI